MRIIDQMVKQLRLPETVAVARDIADTGNTSAVSLPLATARLLAEGAAKPSDHALRGSFGAGSAHAAQVIATP